AKQRAEPAAWWEFGKAVRTMGFLGISTLVAQPALVPTSRTQENGSLTFPPL
ncbi:hypothetical protein P7K49_036450, partial [Saguinus oedipus]